MVNAILKGSKTQTRRVIDLQIDNGFYSLIRCENGGLTIDYNQGGDNSKIKCPYGQAGDLLWVRETWARYYYADQDGITHYDQEMIFYKADGYPDLRIVDADGFEEEDQTLKWKPSIHMPRKVSRLFLKNEGVRVERLLDISDNDALAEGVEPVELGYRDYGSDTLDGWVFPRASFRSLWQSINGEPKPVYKNKKIDSYVVYPWGDEEAAHFGNSWKGKPLSVYPNPWVWVVQFNKIEKEASQ